MTRFSAVFDQASGLYVLFGQNQRCIDLKEVNKNVTRATSLYPGTFWMELGNPTDDRIEVVASVGNIDVRHGSSSPEDVRGIVLPERASWKCAGWMSDGPLDAYPLTRFSVTSGEPPVTVLLMIYREDMAQTEPPGESPEALPKHRLPGASERFGATKFARGSASQIRVQLACPSPQYHHRS